MIFVKLANGVAAKAGLPLHFSDMHTLVVGV
jgi:hypothetical protein